MKNYKIFYKKLSIILASSFVLTSIPNCKMVVNAEEISSEDIQNDINNLLDTLTITSSKEIIIDNFITIVEYVNSAEFNELSENTKESILKQISTIDYLINLKYPNYKDKLSDTKKEIYDNYLIIKDELLEQLENKISEENMKQLEVANETIKQTSNEVVESSKKLFSDLGRYGKQKVKKWYEELKKDNQ